MIDGRKKTSRKATTRKTVGGMYASTPAIRCSKPKSGFDRAVRVTT